ARGAGQGGHALLLDASGGDRTRRRAMPSPRRGERWYIQDREYGRAGNDGDVHVAQGVGMARLARRLRSVLVVDDDKILLSALERDLRSRGMTVLAAPTAERAREIARSRRPDCALVDLCIGEDSGIDLLRDLKAELPDLLVVLLTGYGAVQNVVDAFHGGAVDFLQKPVGGQQLLQALERALARARAGSAPTLA